MDINNITVADFKALFYRDFAYLPVWDVDTLYNAGKRTYYTVTELFYDCIANGTLGDLPTDADHWTQVADDVLNYISDQDIEKAMAEARMAFNTALWGDDDEIKMAFLYLTGFFLVNDIKAALGGISGAANFPVSSRSVGSVSESYHIPDAYAQDPTLAAYMANPYGAKYLMLAIPRIRGNVRVVAGRTLP